MASGSGTQQTTQSTSSNSPQVTALTNKLADRLSKQVDTSSKAYGSPLYTGLSGTTTNGINTLNAQAGAGQAGLNNAFNWTNGVINSGGYNPALTQAQGGIQSYINAASADSPVYQAQKANLISDVTNATNSSFNASGRFAGGANANQLGQGLSRGLVDLESDRMNRQLAGSQALAGIGQTAFTNAAGAASALPGQFTATLAPGQAQIAAGSLLDADSLARRQADYDLYQRQQDAPWSNLARASSILSGTAGAAGQTTTNTVPTAPLWQQALGYVVGNAGRAASIFS